MKKIIKNQDGITLVEVLLAIVLILGFIVSGVCVSLRKYYENRILPVTKDITVNGICNYN